MKILRAHAFCFTLCLIALGCCRARPAYADLSRLDNLLYQAPDGWREVDKDPLVAYAPPDLVNGEIAYLLLVKGSTLTGSFADWFSQTVVPETGSTLIAQSDVQTGQNDDGVEERVVSQQVRDSAGKDSFRVFAGFHPGDRAEIVGLYANSAALQTKYFDAFTALVHSVKFVNLENVNNPPPALPNPPKGAPLLFDNSGMPGIYFRSDLFSQFNPITGFYDNSIWDTYLLLTADGHYYNGFNFIEHGLTDESFKSLEAAKDTHSGTYKLDGTALTFTSYDGETKAHTLAQSGDTVTFDGKQLFRLPSLVNVRLDTTVSRETFVNTGGTDVSGEHHIVFHPDGRFEWTDYVGFTTETNNRSEDPDSSVVATGSNSSYTGGTYEIKGYSIDLHFDNGATLRHTFLKTDSGSLQVDGASFIVSSGEISVVPVPVPSGPDLDADGQVTVADAVLALQIIVGIKEGTPAQVHAGDLNGDGSLDVSDVTKILRIVVGLPPG